LGCGWPETPEILLHKKNLKSAAIKYNPRKALKKSLMKGYRMIKVLLWAVATVFLLVPNWLHAEYEYIDIDTPYLRKLPLAIPLFVGLSDGAVDQATLEKTTEILEQTLDFTSYFDILNRGVYLVDPQKPAITTDDINFNNWISIGAELLVTGGLTQNGDVITMELRLFDTYKARRLVGKRYKGSIKDRRQMIRRFCSEVIYKLTGNRGIFHSRIAFVSTTPGNKEIYFCDFDGSNTSQFTYNKQISLFPAWSSDGNWIAYTSYVNGKPDIYIKNLNENVRTIIDKKGLNITPAWFPGKFQLAATLSFSGDQEIYLLTGKGKIIKRLTYKWGSDFSPAWSPDGKKLAFVSLRAGTPQIYIRDMVSGRIERLTFQGRDNTQPSWSPRGDKIVYTSIEEGRSNIFVIGLNGQEPIRLTQDSRDNEAPSWSPDGSLIAFSTTREGPSRIYVMTAYGTDQRRLLTLPGEQTNPKWSPNFIKN
jgi:TolB protein